MGGINKIEFEHVFNDWYEPIRNFIYYKSGDIRIAEDITQDVFMKVWEKSETIRLESIKSFLYTLANNMFLNRIEHQNVHLKFTVNYKPALFNESPDFELELKEFNQHLQEAISRLDEKKRTVFLMNRIENYTYNEIAESLNITVKAVEKRMEKALSFLRGQTGIKI